MLTASSLLNSLTESQAFLMSWLEYWTLNCQHASMTAASVGPAQATCRSCISLHDVAQLCEALEQGHLWQLTSFTLKAAGTGSDALYERLASLLGKQLTQLNTNHVQLMSHLPLFQHVSSVWLYQIPANSLATVAADLNSLPKLFEFRIVGSCNTCGRTGNQDGSSSSGKKWVLSQTLCACVAALPLSQVQTVDFCGGLYIGDCGKFDFSAIQLLRPKQLACSGNSRSEVGIALLCTEELRVLWHIRDARTVNIGPLVDLSRLSNLWQFLPACVEHIRLMEHEQRCSSDLWVLVRSGLPTSISVLEIRGCAMYGWDFLPLISLISPHVRVLQLVAVQELQCSLFQSTLRRLSPEHLTIEFS